MEQIFPNRKSTLNKNCGHQSATHMEATQCCNDSKNLLNLLHSCNNLTASLIICFHLKIVYD